MTSVGDMFQLKVFCTSAGGTEEFMNVYWYVLNTFGTNPIGTPVAAALMGAWNAQIKPDLSAIMISSGSIVRYEVVNYGDPTDFGIGSTVFGLPQAGLRLGNSVPLATTVSFRYERNAAGARSGWKRFGALSETDINNNSVTVPYKALLDTLAASLFSNLVNVALVSFSPRVATGLKVLGFNPSSYAPLDVAYAGVGTQTTRKLPLSPLAV